MAWVALATALWWWVHPKQLERGCWLGEWPFEEGCSAFARGAAADNPPTLYAQHLQRNVGDSHAYVWLTQRWWSTDKPRALALLAHTSRLAPHDNGVLALRADASLQAQDWPAAAEALTDLVERGYAPARQPLALLMLDTSSQEAVRAQLRPGARWLDTVLVSLDPKLPVAPLLPFVIDGMQLGVVRLATAMVMVDRLKGSSDWGDAYALWVAALGQVKDGLYNAGFDQAATHKGFDWIWPRQTTGKQGVRISQTSAAPRAGHMLQIELTSRAAVPQPMVQQSMVLLGEHFKLSGRYMSDRFRTREGVVWALRCANGGDRWAQTAALKDTQRQWVTFELEARIPDSCQGAVRLQLETTELWEAKSGLSGVLYFDDFEWKPINGDAAE